MVLKIKFFKKALKGAQESLQARLDLNKKQLFMNIFNMFFIQ